MGIFWKSREELELDELLARVENNMSNNYKDAAQADFAEFAETLAGLIAAGRLKGRTRECYEAKCAAYRKQLEGYSHKDQKPYWT